MGPYICNGCIVVVATLELVLPHLSAAYRKNIDLVSASFEDFDKSIEPIHDSEVELSGLTGKNWRACI